MRALVPVLLAACLLAVPPLSAEDEQPTIRMYGCTVHYGEVPVPFLEAQAMMPPGFSAKRHFASGAAPALATHFVTGERCERVVLPDGTVVHDFHDIVNGVFVDPPAGMGLGFNGILTDLCTSSPETALYFRAWNLDADAECDIAIETVVAEGRPIGGATVATGGTTAFSLNIATPGLPTAPGPLPWRVFGRGADGSVTNYADYVLLSRTGHMSGVTAAYGPGGPFTAVSPGGLGGLLTSGPDALFQTLTYRPLP